ncbi:Tyr recombinase domain-containing protein [Pseudomonas chlororaphis]
MQVLATRAPEIPVSYLARRDGRYSYRRRFPADVAALIGRNEYRKALGTADRSEALRLSHAVSVEFDRICDAAVAANADPVPQSAEPETVEAQARTATEVLDNLNAMVRGFTLNITERMQSSGWQSELEWRRASLEAHARGTLVLPGLDIHPVEARAMLRALDDTLAGNPPRFDAPAPGGAPAPAAAAVPSDTVTEAAFQTVLEDYYEGVGPSRVSKLKSLARRVLAWPSTPAEQLERVMQYCAERLEAGGKATSVHGDAAALITVLRRVPGWQSIALPRTGATARAVRSGGGMNVNQRDSIPLERMLNLHAEMKRQVPVHHSTVVLLARYGLRPGELLQEGPEALGYRVDILGNQELVFKAALSGGKNAAARRDVPVHADDAGMFREVLAGLDLAKEATPVQRDRRIRQRVRNVSRVFNRLLGEGEGLSLYSQRHTCADLLRAVGATAEEVGGVLGHTAAGAKATSIYGGSQPLDRPRELLEKVRAFIPS